MSSEPIAVIGSACRFPGGCSSPSKLWELLRQPRDVLRDFDPDRLNLKRFYHPNGENHGSTNVLNKSYLLEEDTRLFDASFFGISPLEAAGMDPQQRILLETVYEATETAGINLDQLRGSLTSVHAGVMTNDWGHIQRRDLETISQHAATGVTNSIIANRISYAFDLKGMSETIDTACSSSLVALHNATRALQSHDSDMAIVAGVNLILDPYPYISESKLHMLSPDSRCRMWDQSANGYGRGEGAAVVILKTLSRALEDGDQIEGIVRGTFVNSDGQSTGITMPSAEAQTALIRQTYLKAGLDPASDRPQYFECHGTGTPAGDPIEARAIREAFISDCDKRKSSVTDDPIYVGSIKSVVGHLEGCAGLAGVIKVLLSLKHRSIPPNLWFENLNPAISPYYGPLQIPTTKIPWPKLPTGTPLRASVNSFGFGGTNAHAIIESFEESTSNDLYQASRNEAGPKISGIDDPIGPLLISAKTEAVLLRNVQALFGHLKDHPEINFPDLSWLLYAKRSIHRVRAHFSGASRNAVLANMENFITTRSIRNQELLNDENISKFEEPGISMRQPRILGIFTGQGAQWPAMGRELIRKSPLFRKTLERCETILQELPAQDAPSWSLIHELMLDGSASQLSQAEISQPLCTAVQIALVELLKASGIYLNAVVGHSSGEIAAAYASEIITLKGAMHIAYYRGYHAKLACGDHGQQGGMLAAGLSFEKATEFCNQPIFASRLQVAASNGPQTTTLSGDEDAIFHAKRILDAENTFARVLNVDKAYHSVHVNPCAQPYLESLYHCKIEVRRPRLSKCIWTSSVRSNADSFCDEKSLESLKGSYWVENMVQPVLYSQAIESATRDNSPFDLAIEVGPHPALKGPTEQVLKSTSGSLPLYTHVLNRGKNDVEVFSSALGSIWALSGSSCIDLAGYQKAFSRKGQSPSFTPKLIKDLPPYSWNHERIYWNESRISRNYRTRRGEYHELLGRRSPDDHDGEMRWRNVLKLQEIPWLQGHKVLDEVLLPGAAYISMALEAGRQLALSRNRLARLFEVNNMEILHPVVVPNHKDGTEMLFSMNVLGGDGHTNDKDSRALRASFSLHIFNSSASGSAIRVCGGEIFTHLVAEKHTKMGERITELPPRQPLPPNLFNINCDDLYSLFKSIGLEYSGVFHGIKSSSRRLGFATGDASWEGGSLCDNYVLHPAILDVAFQTVFIARAHPDSGQIRSALLPTRIEKIKVNPSVLLKSTIANGNDVVANFDSWVLKQTATSLTGDLNGYEAATGEVLLQVEGLEVKTVGEQDAIHDRLIFSKTVWGPDVSLVRLPECTRDASTDEIVLSLVEASERMALFYMKRVMDEITLEDRSQAIWYHQRMLESFDHHLAKAMKGMHPYLPVDWLSDDSSTIQTLDEEYPNSVELQMVHAVGRNLASVVRREKHMLEVMRVGNLLDRFYAEDKRMHQINRFLANALQHITFKFPRCKILEIGAGTGATTWTVLDKIDGAFDTYTYTDLSAGFFSNAADKFTTYRDKMIFKTLDIEQDPTAQGYIEHSYDIIIAANVLHATKNLDKVIQNVHSMLKPGGYLLLHENTAPERLYTTFSFGGLEGWWLAEEEERRFCPLLSPIDWNIRLEKNGFSGADFVAHNIPDPIKQQDSLIISQALNDRIVALRDPLSSAAKLHPLQVSLLIIGGQTAETVTLRREILKLLPEQWRSKVIVIDRLSSLNMEKIDADANVLCMHEVDEPLFATSMTETPMRSLQSLLMATKKLLWVTGAQSSTCSTPRSIMFRGIARVVAGEIPQLDMQVFGVEASTPLPVAARHIVEALLRLREKRFRSEATCDGTQELWLHEPEVDLLSNSQLIIPRVRLDTALNDTYNASNRSITNDVEPSRVPVQVVANPSRLSLQATMNDVFTSLLPIRVHYSLHLPDSPTGMALYLVSGYIQSSPASTEPPSPVMAISTYNASIVEAKLEMATPIKQSDVRTDVLILAARWITMQAIEKLTENNCDHSLLLYGAEKSLADMVASRLARQGYRAYFASSVSPNVSESWLQIYEHSSKHSIRNALPFDVGVFIDCLEYTESFVARGLLRSCLPAGCIVKQLDASYLMQILEDDKTLLPAAYSYTRLFPRMEPDQQRKIDVLPAAELVGIGTEMLAHKRYITDWHSQKSLTAAIAPMKLEGIFKPDRTYFMVGGAGGLGTSICHWMIRNGAKHIVMTSRNPTGDPLMLEEARRCGASVHLIPMDVCSRPSIETVVDMIRGTMPPIAGVCNAAMVLNDKLFLDMDVDQLNNTLGPKVNGTEHLDSIFSDESLDFFVLLSSAASIIGTVGQSNYHCANIFMESVVAQRRSRGLAASIIHIGYICDAGYVAHRADDRHIQSQRDMVRTMTLSETDVHFAFAQAVRSGRPGSPRGTHSIIMGIQPPTQPLDPNRKKALWLSDPRLGHMVPASPLSGLDQKADYAAATSGSIRQQVEEAGAENEAVPAILSAFCIKLESILLLPVGSIKKDGVDRPMIDLGIDSLIAVEIRTWLLSELGVQMPVVKILAGDTVRQLCISVAKSMAKALDKTPMSGDAAQDSSDVRENQEDQEIPSADAMRKYFEALEQTKKTGEQFSLTPFLAHVPTGVSSPPPSKSVSETDIEEWHIPPSQRTDTPPGDEKPFHVFDKGFPFTDARPESKPSVGEALSSLFDD